jgi:hypothetical protein
MAPPLAVGDLLSNECLVLEMCRWGEGVEGGLLVAESDVSYVPFLVVGVGRLLDQLVHVTHHLHQNRSSVHTKVAVK